MEAKRPAGSRGAFFYAGGCPVGLKEMKEVEDLQSQQIDLL